MRRTLAILAFALAVAGCDTQSSADDKALADARDIERVEASQNMQPPIQMLAPEPITYADIEKAKLLGASCTFLPRDQPGKHVALAIADAAYVKIAGELKIHAADKGSPSLPLGGWTRYEGRSHLLDLQIIAGEGTKSSEETTDWPGRLTIRDSFDRLVYSAPGTVRCGV